MWNPFRTPLRPTAYVPPADDVSATNWTVHANAVELNDANYPEQQYIGDQSPAPGGNFADRAIDSGSAPGYATGVEDEGRTLLYEPGAVHGYAFLPHDLATPVDIGTIPGTASANVHHGPVTGRAMDNYREGMRAVVPTRAVGYRGPVTGFAGPDYAQQVAYSTYQQFLGQYSTAAATDAQIAAI